LPCTEPGPTGTLLAVASLYAEAQTPLTARMAEIQIARAARACVAHPSEPMARRVSLVNCFSWRLDGSEPPAVVMRALVPGFCGASGAYWGLDGSSFGGRVERGRNAEVRRAGRGKGDAHLIEE